MCGQRAADVQLSSPRAGTGMFDMCKNNGNTDLVCKKYIHQPYLEQRTLPIKAPNDQNVPHMAPGGRSTGA